jgi:hypothetical protein
MERTNKYIAYWGLAMIWPFLGFVVAIRAGLSSLTLPVILFFSFLYGYSIYLYGGDILHYRDSFDDVAAYSWNDYVYLVTHTLDTDKGSQYHTHVAIQKPDIFALTFQFLVSRFTDNPRWFWGFLSVFYTYLIVLFVKEVAHHLPNKRKYWYEQVFIVALLMVIPFYVGVTGVRFWPALFIFLIFVLKHLSTNSIKYLFLSALSVLIHYSFFFPVSLYLIIALTGFRRWSVGPVVISAFVVVALSSTTDLFMFLQNWATVFEDTSVEQNVGGYVDQDIYKMRIEKASARNWYVQLSSDLLLYLLLTTCTIDFFGISKLRDTPLTSRLFLCGLLFFSLTLLSFNLGSIGRFKNIFFLLMLVRYAILLNAYPKKMYLKTLAYMLVPVLALHILVSFRSGFYTVDPLLLIGNPITLLLSQSSESLSELLVGH